MLHITKRCIHCNTEYNYQVSGEGCQRPENNERYCPECAAKIIAALKDVPKKFEKKYNPTPLEYNEEIWSRIEKVYNKVLNPTNDYDRLSTQMVVSSPTICALLRTFDDENSFVNGFQIMGVHYAVRRNKDTKTIISVHRLDEYDCSKNEFTGNSWDRHNRWSNENDDSYCGKYQNLFGAGTLIPKDKVPVSNVPKPSGDIFFCDCLNIVKNSNETNRTDCLTEQDFDESLKKLSDVDKILSLKRKLNN